MNTHPAGTVAVATVRGVGGVRVWRHEHGWCTPTEFNHESSGEVTDVRPLVVLDPEHPSIRYFISKWVDVLPGEASGIETTVGAARYLSQQIEAQTKPPRIPEPGLWGVVESTVTYEGTTYSTSLVRHPGPGTANCWLDRSGSWFSWDDLIDPVLIREGVES